MLKTTKQLSMCVYAYKRGEGNMEAVQLKEGVRNED